MTCPSCTDLSDRLDKCRVAMDRMAELIAQLDYGVMSPMVREMEKQARRAFIEANAALAKERSA